MGAWMEVPTELSDLCLGSCHDTSGQHGFRRAARSTTATLRTVSYLQDQAICGADTWFTVTLTGDPRHVFGSRLLTIHCDPWLSYKRDPWVVLISPVRKGQVQSTDGGGKRTWPCVPPQPIPRTVTYPHHGLRCLLRWLSRLLQATTLLDSVLFPPTSCCPCCLRPCLVNVDMVCQNGTGPLALPAGNNPLGWWPCVADRGAVSIEKRAHSRNTLITAWWFRIQWEILYIYLKISNSKFETTKKNYPSHFLT